MGEENGPEEKTVKPGRYMSMQKLYLKRMQIQSEIEQKKSTDSIEKQFEMARWMRERKNSQFPDGMGGGPMGLGT